MSPQVTQYYYGVRKQCRKLISFLRRDFNSSKCKTWAQMTTARIKLLRNKKLSLVRQMRRDIASLLQSRQDATARIRVEHVIREQNMMAANEIIQLFCDRLVTSLSILANKRGRECPTDLKEPISSLIFAAPRCSDIPELLSIRDIFLKKYGKDFVSAAADLRPGSAVNRLLVEKLSALSPPGELKLKVMKEIAKEYQVEWDTAETEAELLKPPEERLDGPRTFVSAASLPLNSIVAPIGHKLTRLPCGDNRTDINIEDMASSAKPVAYSAKNVVSAATAAVRLAQNKNHEDDGRRHYKAQTNNYSHNGGYDNMGLSTRHDTDDDHGDTIFDDSDCDEEIEVAQPTSGIHPTVDSSNARSSSRLNLPDYDVIAARLEELKYSRT